eukprot:GHVO01070185.1.p2 GENE.GHVO01070185.1~~GHVO01070185.1.p2  ORF type:complete len:105 (+),score=12.49 GHVO01070185.1:143-457(+)
MGPVVVAEVAVAVAAVVAVVAGLMDVDDPEVYHPQVTEGGRLHMEGDEVVDAVPVKDAITVAILVNVTTLHRDHEADLRQVTTEADLDRGIAVGADQHKKNISD